MLRSMDSKYNPAYQVLNDFYCMIKSTTGCQGYENSSFIPTYRLLKTSKDAEAVCRLPEKPDVLSTMNTTATASFEKPKIECKGNANTRL